MFTQTVGHEPGVAVEWSLVLLRNSARKPVILPSGFQSPDANAGIVPRIRSQPLPFVSFPIHYSLLTYSNATKISELSRT
jgi:hypothetical protein